MSKTASKPKLRILIVEDDPMMQLGLEQTLSTVSDFEIVGQAEDGYLAIEAAATLKPDVVVMDIGLPRLDGISATKQIKEKFPNMGVVMLTSHRLQTEVVAALSSGADGYCIKGANIERLVTAIQAAKEGGSYLDPQVARLVMNNLHPVVPAEKREALHTLSEREMEVLKWIVEGKSNNEIAEILYLSPNTIKTHVRGLMNKLSVDDRVQAAVIALRSGLV
ncbi:response regulator transcription factor [Spirulina subsalsa FACHB-351]|uniref:Response regulator transcription factor n=1 Tax=Spirulina subsalsa FACHB-351 TaxID=234711 RepID=A0ABT3L0Y7_9CYAN|nr:response regulator transcription factor [Spirulina subsalsa]MCW6034842.1 response regulator transcription factor [Spirulina subsalsa FACHB-351]